MHQIVVICPECGTRNICSTESFPEYNFTCVGAGCEIDCSHYPQWTKSWEGNYEVFSVGTKSKASGLREQQPSIKSHKLLISTISLIVLLVLTGTGVGVYEYVNRWEPGIPHPQNSNLISSQYGGVWKSTRAGYKWVEGTAHDRWQAVVRHPDNSYLVSCDEEGKWKSTKAGYAWAGGSGIEWRAGLPHDEYAHWHSSDEEGKWTADSGYVEKNPSSKYVSELVWKKGLRHREHVHWISSKKEGVWDLETGYEKVYPDINNSSNPKAWLVKRTTDAQYSNKELSRNIQSVRSQIDELIREYSQLQQHQTSNSLVLSRKIKLASECNKLLYTCRKLQQAGFDSPELREVVRRLSALGLQSESDYDDEDEEEGDSDDDDDEDADEDEDWYEGDDDDAYQRDIRRVTPKYA